MERSPALGTFHLRYRLVLVMHNRVADRTRLDTFEELIYVCICEVYA